MKIPIFFIKMVIFGKNDHFSSKKKKKKAIFIFLKTPIKVVGQKKYIITLDTFFIFYFKKIKIKKAKVGQKLEKKVGSLSSIFF
jgi:hypothetical protein